MGVVEIQAALGLTEKEEQEASPVPM